MPTLAKWARGASSPAAHASPPHPVGPPPPANSQVPCLQSGNNLPCCVYRWHEEPQRALLTYSPTSIPAASCQGPLHLCCHCARAAVWLANAPPRAQQAPNRYLQIHIPLRAALLRRQQSRPLCLSESRQARRLLPLLALLPSLPRLLLPRNTLRPLPSARSRSARSNSALSRSRTACSCEARANGLKCAPHSIETR